MQKQKLEIEKKTSSKICQKHNFTDFIIVVHTVPHVIKIGISRTELTNDIHTSFVATAHTLWLNSLNEFHTFKSIISFAFFSDLHTMLPADNVFLMIFFVFFCLLLFGIRLNEIITSLLRFEFLHFENGVAGKL